MRRAEDQVLAFQRHIKAAKPRLVVEESENAFEVHATLGVAEVRLSGLSDMLKELYRRTPDERLMRMQLMCEELSEVASALAEGDLTALCDGVADLAYVVVGTAVTYRLPLAELFDEVHRSNMTKCNVRHAHGVKGKGPGFTPPDIAGVILAHGWR